MRTNQGRSLEKNVLIQKFNDVILWYFRPNILKCHNRYFSGCSKTVNFWDLWIIKDWILEWSLHSGVASVLWPGLQYDDTERLRSWNHSDDGNTLLPVSNRVCQQKCGPGNTMMSPQGCDEDTVLAWQHYSAVVYKRVVSAWVIAIPLHCPFVIIQRPCPWHSVL